MNNEIILTLALILGTIASLRSLDYFLTKLGAIKKVSEKRTYYISKSISFLVIVVAFLLLAIIWSVSLDGVLIFASSIFTVVGVALFAQWSILSNLTASIIIFFTFPARVGDTITIIDGDNTVTGTIIEISLFTIELLDADGETIMYPNNLFIQKPIKKLKKTKEDMCLES
ncbi:mechanosensitive ion channel [Sulfurimonas aquatica]|uniref:Mechanosensitive ion channel n=1 Tax=Sulfurimonas aquatica TaxID=2672570 RepID=A0A975B288_9BACT|nr:mechanosensitive ion channel domain-containing protein [Sulfurimonas aquatica]QSZ42911.1 mechanosensitive ion channel [Sulfurimonas aquatica]